MKKLLLTLLTVLALASPSFALDYSERTEDRPNRQTIGVTVGYGTIEHKTFYSEFEDEAEARIDFTALSYIEAISEADVIEEAWREASGFDKDKLMKKFSKASQKKATAEVAFYTQVRLFRQSRGLAKLKAFVADKDYSYLVE